MNTVHYLGTPITITQQGFRVGDTTFTTIAEAKLSIVKNRKK